MMTEAEGQNCTIPTHRRIYKKTLQRTLFWSWIRQGHSRGPGPHGVQMTFGAHTLSSSPLAAHLSGCAPPAGPFEARGLRWREISKMAAARAAPARDADTATPRLESRRVPTDSRVPDVAPLREEAREDARVALRVPPGTNVMISWLGQVLTTKKQLWYRR